MVITISLESLVVAVMLVLFVLSAEIHIAFFKLGSSVV